MVKICIKCKSKSLDVFNTNKYHRFPDKLKKPELHQLWLNFLERNQVEPGTTICSDHFRPQDFKNFDRKRLKDNAVPSIHRKGDVVVSEPAPSLILSGGLPRNVAVKQTGSHSRVVSQTRSIATKHPTVLSFIRLPRVGVVEGTGHHSHVKVTNSETEKLNSRFNNEGCVMSESRNVISFLGTPKGRMLGEMRRSDFITEEAWSRYRKSHLLLKSQLRKSKYQESMLKLKLKTSQKYWQVEHKLKNVPLLHNLEGDNFMTVNKPSKKRSGGQIKKQVYPVHAPTRFSFKVNRPYDIREYDYISNKLSIRTDLLICCVCFKIAQKLDQLQPVLSDGVCNDFGRIFSIVLNLSESEIVSQYCCMSCSDRVLDCFNALLELNLSVSCAVIKFENDRNKIKSSPYVCSLCQFVSETSQQLMDHVMLHAVEPLSEVELFPDGKPNSEITIAVGEDIEEGELLPLNVGKTSVLPSTSTTVSSATTVEEEHGYCSNLNKLKQTETKDFKLCHICGVLKCKMKVLTKHIKTHMKCDLTPLGAYRCSVCKMEMADRLALHNHLIEAHGVDDKLPKTLKKCRLCDLVFSSGMVRSRHEQVEHEPESYFLCPYCPRMFQFYDGVVGHSRKKHPDEFSNDFKKADTKDKRKRPSNVKDVVGKPKKKKVRRVEKIIEDVPTYEDLVQDLNYEYDCPLEAEAEAESGIEESLVYYPVVDMNVKHEDVALEAATYIFDYIDGPNSYEEQVITFQ